MKAGQRATERGTVKPDRSYLEAQPGGGFLQRGAKPLPAPSLTERSARIRTKLLAQLENVADDLAVLLDQQRIWADMEGMPRCEKCGSVIPRAVKIKLPAILAVIRELRAILPAQLEVTGVLANIDLSRLSDDKLARIADGEHPMSVLGSEG